MSEKTAVATVETRDIATMPIAEAIEAFAPNFAAVLPPTVPLDHFKRMVVTAINTNPELMNADRRTLFNACVKCASDGLLPDGREAALVVYRTKVKDRHGQERYIDAVQYLSMIAGIRKRLRNSGEVASADAFVIYRRDKFSYRLGDNPFIEHIPAPLDEEPGEEVGAYAIIKLTNGEILRDVMRKSEIEKARAQSRAPNSLMWTKFKGEGYKKTVLRRCSKAAPQAATLEKLLARDDELPELPPAETLAAVPPPPRRADYLQPVETEPATFPLVNADGEIIDHNDPGHALNGLAEEMRQQALARGEDGLEGVWESNAALISAFREADRDDLAEQAHTLHDDMKAELAGKARRRTRKPAEPPELDEPREDAGEETPAQAATAARDRHGKEVVPDRSEPHPSDNATAPAINSAGASVASVPRVPVIAKPLDQYEAIQDALRGLPPGAFGDFATVNHRAIESLRLSAPALYAKVNAALAAA